MNKEETLKKYKRRVIDTVIEEYLVNCGAVCVEGPKWCGKTWTSLYHCQSFYSVGSSENNFQNRAFAQIAPKSVLQGAAPRLIDEWQEVPALWDAVRAEVDERGEHGQFILTGSATPKRKGILHSGTGRIVPLRMRPMSLYESGDSSGTVSLRDVCRGTVQPQLTGDVSLEQLAGLIVRGGFPGNLSPVGNIGMLATAYIDSVLQNDVQNIDGIAYDKHKIHLLLKSLARNEATLATQKSLMEDIREYEGETLNPETVATYLNLVSRMFLTDNQEPFAPNYRSALRIRQAEKRHLADPSLVCALLNLTPEKLLGDLRTFGFLFEGLVERDLQVYAQANHARVYHYKDYAENEIDAVVENADGSWSAFEIKLGFHQVESAAAGLLKLQKMFAEKGCTPPASLCVICGMSNAAFTREDGVMVVPITALKD